MFSDRPDLSKFIQKALSIEGTPALIQWLVEDSLRLETAKAIVAKQPDSIYHLAVSVCADNHIDMARLELCLSPAISSLGLLEDVEIQGDFYELLGVSSDADADQIKKAYREIVRRIHPDVTSDLDDGHDQFTSVTQAYKTLSNPGLRRQYDQTRVTAVSWQEAPPLSSAANGNGRQSSKPWLKISLAVAGLLILFVFLSLYFESVFYRQSLTEPVRPKPTVVSKPVATMPKPPLNRTVIIPQPPAEGESESKPPSIPPERYKSAHKPVNAIAKQIVKPSPRPKPKAIIEAPISQPIAPPMAPTKPQPVISSDRFEEPMDHAELSSIPTHKPTYKPDPEDNISQINTHEINPPEPSPTSAQGLTERPSPSIPEPQTPSSGKKEALQLLSQLVQSPTQEQSKQNDINSKLDQLTGTDRKKAVLDFVQTYADIYARKDPNAYLALFAPGATQNGQALEGLRDEYATTLENKEDVVYTVEVDQVVFDPFKLTAKAVSHFKLKFQSGDYLKTYAGPITFTFVNKLDQPLIIRDLQFNIADRQEAFNPSTPLTAPVSESMRESVAQSETGVGAPDKAVQQAKAPPVERIKVSPAEPETKEEKAIPYSLNAFVQRYKDIYEARNIDRYKHLFGHGATENGEPFESRVPIYEKQFGELSEVHYQLKILDWEQRKNTETGFLVTCSYDIEFSRKGRQRSSSGKITFSIKDEEGILKIESMRY